MQILELYKKYQIAGSCMELSSSSARVAPNWRIPCPLIAAMIKNGVDYAGTSDDKQRHGNYLRSAQGQQE
jgi:hypothetical protein